MNHVATGLVIIPGAVALLVFLVFTYLYEQNRQTYFRAWQLAWAAYTLHYAIEALEYFQGASALLFLLLNGGELEGVRLLAPKTVALMTSDQLTPSTDRHSLVAMTLGIFLSTRLMRDAYQPKWYDTALAAGGVVLTYVNLRAHMVNATFVQNATLPAYRLEVGMAAVMFASTLFE